MGNSGQVTINCPGIDEKALQYLRQQLQSQNDASRTIRNLNDLNDSLRQQADDWAGRYRDLSARLASDGSEEDRQARALIQQGEFAKAEAILEALAVKQEAQVARAAATQYSLGDLAMLRFDAPRALLYYTKAFRYQPDNPLYAYGYARGAYHERRYAEAEEGWTNALRHYRDLATRDGGAYRPYVAGTLNNLAVLYRATGRLAEAEKAYDEALTIRRDLATRDPGAYRPDVAQTLNNLAVLYSATGRLAEAEKAYDEALTIYRDLATRNPAVYVSKVKAVTDALAKFRK